MNNLFYNTRKINGSKSASYKAKLCVQTPSPSVIAPIIIGMLSIPLKKVEVVVVVRFLLW